MNGFRHLEPILEIDITKFNYGRPMEQCRAISSQLRHVSTIGKKNLLSSNESSTCCFSFATISHRVKRTDRLSCFVDRLHRLVDDFMTRLDLGRFPIDAIDLRPC